MGCLTVAPKRACAASPKSLGRIPISGLTANVLRAAVSLSLSGAVAPATGRARAGATRETVARAFVLRALVVAARWRCVVFVGVVALLAITLSSCRRRSGTPDQHGQRLGHERGLGLAFDLDGV